MTKTATKLLTMIMLIVSQRAFSLTPQVKPMLPEKVSDLFILIENKEMEGLHPYWKGILTWPSPNEIKSRQVNKGAVLPKEGVDEKLVTKAIDSTMEWLGRVLKPEWVPEKSEIDILALTSDIEGSDSVRLQYRMGDYTVQVASIHPTIWIAVKNNKKETPSHFSIEQAKKHAQEIMGLFVQVDEKMMQKQFTNLQPLGKGFFSFQSNKPENWNWRGMMSWWTDGNVFLIYTNKSFGNGRMPGDLPKWFSETPTMMPKKPLSQDR